MSSRRRLPDYLRAKIELRSEQREHLRYHSPDCQCPVHVGRSGLDLRLAGKLEQQRRGMSEPPF